MMRVSCSVSIVSNTYAIYGAARYSYSRLITQRAILFAFKEMLKDTPEEIVTIINETHAESTDLAAPENVEGLAGKCEDKAEKWAPVADGIWSEAEAMK